MKQLKSEHADKLASASKQNEENVKLNSINVKLTKDLQKLNSTLGSTNIEVEVLKKKLLDVEDMNRKLRMDGTAASKEIERLKKDRDKAVLAAQKHYEKYEDLKSEHKAIKKRLDVSKRESKKTAQKKDGPNSADLTGTSSTKNGKQNKTQRGWSRRRDKWVYQEIAPRQRNKLCRKCW